MRFKADSCKAQMYVYLPLNLQRDAHESHCVCLSDTGQLQRNAVLHPGNEAEVMCWLSQLIS
jgi:hypothetical protein